MKVTWEKTDIVPGRRVTKAYENAEVWLIGYDPEHHSSDDERLVLISLNDGMLSFKNQTREQIAVTLNSGEYQPVDLIAENRKWRNS